MVDASEHQDGDGRDDDENNDERHDDDHQHGHTVVGKLFSCVKTETFPFMTFFQIFTPSILNILKQY